MRKDRFGEGGRGWPVMDLNRLQDAPPCPQPCFGLLAIIRAPLGCRIHAFVPPRHPQASLSQDPLPMRLLPPDLLPTNLTTARTTLLPSWVCCSSASALPAARSAARNPLYRWTHCPCASHHRFRHRPASALPVHHPPSLLLPAHCVVVAVLAIAESTWRLPWSWPTGGSRKREGGIRGKRGSGDRTKKRDAPRSLSFNIIIFFQAVLLISRQRK